MIYLIFKMALYLLVALGSGAAAGWLMRNRSASKWEEEWSRELDEHKSKLLQLESLMRSRDEQLQALRVEAKEKATRIGGLRDEVGTASKALKSAEAQLEQTKDAQARDVEGGSSATVAELMAEVARLRSELSDARVRVAASELTREGGTSEEQLRLEL
jgi:chromosome segregation ATPase